ncbi:MAG: metallopeptidase family protein [Dehalococcoidia bacterium]|nr:metallopeptidase family protein [Dehalococcoidia bacterium]
MHRRRFQMLVSRYLRSLPHPVLERLDNVAIVTARRPTAEQLANQGLLDDEDLLGLYEGVPLTERGGDYGMVLPDRITLFQEPIEAMCSNDAEIRSQILQTIVHEIGHHMGLTDQDLKRLGWE